MLVQNLKILTIGASTLLLLKTNKDFNFEIDLYVDKFNNRVKKYVTQFYDPEALALNSFAIPWTD
jgi:hypothetical protein